MPPTKEPPPIHSFFGLEFGKLALTRTHPHHPGKGARLASSATPVPNRVSASLASFTNTDSVTRKEQSWLARRSLATLE